jgi:hypothetical protein
MSLIYLGAALAFEMFQRHCSMSVSGKVGQLLNDSELGL